MWNHPTASWASVREASCKSLHHGIDVHALSVVSYIEDASSSLSLLWAGMLRDLCSVGIFETLMYPAGPTTFRFSTTPQGSLGVHQTGA